MPQLQSVTCPDGSTQNVYLPSTDTLQFFSERGLTVTKIVTPEVKAAVRDHFDCPSLNGAQLENQDGSSGSCFGSHWEERLFMDDLMVYYICAFLYFLCSPCLFICEFTHPLFSHLIAESGCQQTVQCVLQSDLGIFERLWLVSSKLRRNIKFILGLARRMLLCIGQMHRQQ